MSVVRVLAPGQHGGAARRQGSHAGGAEEVVSINQAAKDFTVSGDVVRVLEDVTLSVSNGETVSIVGPSGCGKTTLLRMIQGLEPTSRGTVAVRGQSTSTRDVDAGFVFQQPSLFPWLSVRRNVEFGLRLRARRQVLPADEGRARVQGLIELVGLADFASYRPHQLSGGMRQRVNLARALAVDPAVLLLDEPFSAVDTLTRERLQRVLARSLAELGTTAILVTHDIREAVFLGSRVVVMGGRPGRVLADVTVDKQGPRTEEFQHSAELALIAQSVYGQLRAAEQADDERAGGT